MYRRTTRDGLTAVLAGVLFLGCSDIGDVPVQPVPDPDPAPGGEVVLSTLMPSRSYPGAVVLLLGSGFGGEPGTVYFAAAGSDTVSAAVEAWSDTEISALVPTAAIDGPVVVEADGVMSEPLVFAVAPEVSLGDDVRPIFQIQGCQSCHGGSGGFFVDTREMILAGGVQGPGVIPGNSAESNVIIRLLADGQERMPQGATQPIPAAQILTIADWIDQGARDN